MLRHMGHHEHGHHAIKHGSHGHDAHGNPADLEQYLAKLEGPERAEWQKPDEVIALLSIVPGSVVAEIGAGPGYFALRLATAVGADGTVFAAEVAPAILGVLRERILAAGARNVVPILALPDDPLLPPRSCDLVLVVDAYHHFPDGPAYLRRLARALRAGGRIVNIDFHKREAPVGPSVEHMIARETFVADATAAGLRVVAEHEVLPYQYFLVLAPA